MHFFVWHRAALLAGAAVGAFAGCYVTSVGIARAAEATDICLALAEKRQIRRQYSGFDTTKIFSNAAFGWRRYLCFL